jgi:arginine exporter protein ArgO
MKRIAAWSLFAVALSLLAPEITQACTVCIGGAEEEVRKAFIITTAFLTACPLLMVGALVWWLRRTLRAADEQAIADASPGNASLPDGAALPAIAPR